MIDWFNIDGRRGWEENGKEVEEKNGWNGRTAVYHDRGNHYDEEVEEPVRAGTHCVCFGAGLDRINFGGVELEND